MIEITCFINARRTFCRDKFTFLLGVSKMSNTGNFSNQGENSAGPLSGEVAPAGAILLPQTQVTFQRDIAPLLNDLMQFRRFERATAESKHICLMLVDCIRRRTGSIPVEGDANDRNGEPWFLIYMPDAAPRFALIETIDSRKGRQKVVISIYGKEADHDTAAMQALRVPPRAGYSRIAVETENEVESACSLIYRAYELKRERESRKQARRAR
jgi:hypothetical protein